jgi:hypothetical protein
MLDNDYVHYKVSVWSTVFSLWCWHSHSEQKWNKDIILYWRIVLCCSSLNVVFSILFSTQHVHWCFRIVWVYFIIHEVPLQLLALRWYSMFLPAYDHHQVGQIIRELLAAYACQVRIFGSVYRRNYVKITIKNPLIKLSTFRTLSVVPFFIWKVSETWLCLRPQVRRPTQLDQSIELIVPISPAPEIGTNWVGLFTWERRQSQVSETLF